MTWTDTISESWWWFLIGPVFVGAGCVAGATVKVFISHSSKDKPAVEALARELRARGIDAWLDKWEIAAGDDIVASINRGLEEADAGLIVFSHHSSDSRGSRPRSAI